jgi:hypothetical protein
MMADFATQAQRVPCGSAPVDPALADTEISGGVFSVMLTASNFPDGSLRNS